MKNINKYMMFLFGAFLISSCSEDDKISDQVVAETTRGAVLRTVSSAGTAWDVLNESESLTIEIEEQDIEDGDLLQEVRVFVNLIDNTEDAMTNTTETLLTTIPASSFSSGPNGLPRTTFQTSQNEVASALGVTLGDYNCGDQWNIRMELALTDGRTFTAVDATGNVSGGSFFSSPYVYRISLIAPLSEDDLFTGQYQLTTVTPGIFGVSDYEDGVYMIESVNNTTKVIRNVSTFPAFGPFGPVDVEFQLVCGQIIMNPEQSVGAGCNALILSGPARVNTTYDLVNPDDSEFIINFTSDEASDCTDAVQAAIRLTKV
ncbi:hypothetical protein [Flagellimonas sp. 2504JD1-5]